MKVINGMVGEGVAFQRLRRITGYLADTRQFSAAKKDELSDRVKHFGNCREKNNNDNTEFLHR